MVRCAECVFCGVTAVTSCLGLVDVRGAWLTGGLTGQIPIKKLPKLAQRLDFLTLHER